MEEAGSSHMEITPQSKIKGKEDEEQWTGDDAVACGHNASTLSHR